VSPVVGLASTPYPTRGTCEGLADGEGDAGAEADADGEAAGETPTVGEGRAATLDDPHPASRRMATT